MIAARISNGSGTDRELSGIDWGVPAWGTASSAAFFASAGLSWRWFVPLLAPAYYLLALLLRRHPQYLRDFLVLSGWGVVMAGLMWSEGPWRKHLVPFFWPVQEEIGLFGDEVVVNCAP